MIQVLIATSDMLGGSVEVTLLLMRRAVPLDVAGCGSLDPVGPRVAR
jgi:hypothetical protein